MAAATLVEQDNQPLVSELRRQLRYEINGEDITNPEKFALEQKFGLTDPVLLQRERNAIFAEEALGND